MLDRREWLFQIAALGTFANLSDGAAEWSPQFFSGEQNETAIALGERIIPGSAAALCNRVIDLLMGMEPDNHKNDFRQALDAFDRAAQARFHKPFRQLAPQQQDEILSDAQTNPLQKEFQLLKEWFAGTYWTSQQGLAALGSSGRMAWQEFPGCPSRP